MTTGRLAGPLVAIALTLLLAGCATTPAPEALSGPTMAIARWQPPAAPDHWRLTGRAGVRAADAGATLNVRWRQTAAGYRLDLSGPFGAGAVRLTSDGDGALLETADGERYRAASAEALLKAATGFTLPVDYLRWWVRGLPVPNLGGTVVVDADGRCARVEQAGWVVRCSDYREVGGFALPGRVSVQRDALRMRLAVGAWTALP